jgi:integrase
MSIKQINPGVWYLDVRIWKDGKVYREREKIQGGKKAAETRVFEIRKGLKAQANAEQRSLEVTDFSTFNEVLDFYSENKMSKNHKKICYIHRLKKIGNTPLPQLSKVFKEFIRLEKKSFGVHTGKLLKVGTINQLIALASASMGYALKEEKIKENTLLGIKKEKEPSRWIVLDNEHEKALLEAVKEVSPTILPFVQYSVDVPCRKGEMLRAGSKCYNVFSNVIEIPGSLTKNKQPCTKPVPPGMVQYFRSNPSPWLFYREEKGEYIPLGYIQKAWKRAVKRAGLDKLTDDEGNSLGALRIHDLRHHAVSKLIKAKNSRSSVIAVAGWKRDMLSIYWNFNDEEIAKGIVFEAKPSTSTVHLQEISSKTA